MSFFTSAPSKISPSKFQNKTSSLDGRHKYSKRQERLLSPHPPSRSHRQPKDATLLSDPCWRQKPTADFPQSGGGNQMRCLIPATPWTRQVAGLKLMACLESILRNSFIFPPAWNAEPTLPPNEWINVFVYLLEQHSRKKCEGETTISAVFDPSFLQMFGILRAAAINRFKSHRNSNSSTVAFLSGAEFLPTLHKFCSFVKKSNSFFASKQSYEHHVYLRFKCRIFLTQTDRFWGLSWVIWTNSFPLIWSFFRFFASISVFFNFIFLTPLFLSQKPRLVQLKSNRGAFLLHVAFEVTNLSFLNIFCRFYQK